MQTKRHISALVLTLGLLGISTAALRAEKPEPGTKPLKSVEVTVARTVGLAPGTWQDPFLVQARLSAPGFYVEDSEVLSEGWDNVGGRKTILAHQILFITAFSPTFTPLKARFYTWAETTTANGNQFWNAIQGDVDLVTGVAEGVWTGFSVNDPDSPVTGSGEFVSTARPDLGPRIYETIATGRVLTVGASK